MKNRQQKNPEFSVTRENKTMNFKKTYYSSGFQSHFRIIQFISVLVVLIIIILVINPLSHSFLVNKVNASPAYSSERNGFRNTIQTDSDFKKGSDAQGKLVKESPQSILYVTIFSINHMPDIKISVHPKENSNQLILEIKEGEWKGLNYQLYTRTGNLLVQKNILHYINAIDMQEFMTGSYILKVMKPENTLVQKFVINKKTVSKLQESTF